MSNANKNQHGRKFQESIEYYITSLNSRRTMCGLVKNKRLGYDKYDSTQFYIPYEITFNDGTVWAVYSTTSMRDRFKGQLWDAYNAKQIDSRIEYALLVYPDSIQGKERQAFRNKADSIDSGSYFSYIDFIVSESEFQLMLQEKAMESARFSGGVKGDLRGKLFEGHVAETMSNPGNLAIKKQESTSNESGYSYALFERVIDAIGIDASRVQAITATTDIPLLPSGGPGKTDVVVKYELSTKETVEQKISCKRSLKDKVSVNQYSASEIIRVLKLPSSSDLARAICMYQECGSSSALKDKYGSSGLDFVRSTIESQLKGEKLKKLVKWVVSGYEAGSPDINCADWILIRQGAGTSCSDKIYQAEEYCQLLLRKKPLQMGTPFEWTFASGQRGKSIQFKMKISH